MTYTKPMVIAQSQKTGSYAAGCPANRNGVDWACRNCDRVR